MHPWIQALVSPAEGRYGRKNIWLLSSPRLCPRHPMSLSIQPACIAFNCETGRGLASQYWRGIVETIKSNFHSPQAGMP